jgi:lactobin A/cerein 7B family class IIb bacteriocin
MRELTKNEIQEVNGGWVGLAVRGAIILGAIIFSAKAH